MKKYYKRLDIVRLISCIAILLFHMNILKGGFLAVCTFFVLSGYLSCISAFKKEKFSILSFYKNRLLHIYLPLICTVFISILAISFFKDINWLNLKPETTSVLFGYNNFWQINANADYFARHINSPFIHFWYIAILLQFELLFPFIFLIFKKIGDKLHKIIPCILLLILSIVGTLYFYQMSIKGNVTFVYYNTFTRIFSILFGLSLGFIHSYYKRDKYKILNNKYINTIIFYLYLIILILMFIFIKSTSKYYAISMIISTLISCRLITYSTLNTSNKLNIIDKLITNTSKISYEIYLVQYPIIFIFQYININNQLKIIYIISLILISSILIHIGLSFKKKKHLISNIIMLLISIGVISTSILGGYKYICSKDYTQDMKKLEEQLNDNQKMMEEKQKQYEENLKIEKEKYDNMMNDLEKSEKDIKKMVKKLPVVGIGDSVMLGALDSLYNQFPNGYFDAKVSRTDWMANDILKDLKSKNMLSDNIVFNLGTNGDCGEECKIAILNTCENRNIFWITVTNDKDVHINNRLIELSKKYNNIHIIDWANISKGHPEYFVADGIHLTPQGSKVYAESIYNEIFNLYYKEFKKKKEKILKEHEEIEKNKISFIGNEVLLNMYNELIKDYSDATYYIDKNYSYKKIIETINKDIDNNKYNHKIVLLIDNSLKLTTEQYNSIIDTSKNNYLYIVLFNKINLSNTNNINIIYFDNKNYLMPDKKHLNNQGINKLKEELDNKLQEIR